MFAWTFSIIGLIKYLHEKWKGSNQNQNQIMKNEKPIIFLNEIEEMEGIKMERWVAVHLLVW